MAEKRTEPPRIDHRQALADYLAMSSSRSLRKLRKAYDNNATIRPPSFHTLASWSRKHGWQDEAARYDARVGAQVAEKAEGLAVESGFDQVSEFMDLIEGATAVAKAWIADPGTVKKINNATEFATVANAVARLSQHVELLSGKATSRADGSHRIECPDWLAERLAPEPERDDDSDPVPDPATTRH